MAKIYSASAAVGDSITIPNTDPHYNQLFISASYFSDADLDIPATPSAGTLTCEGKPNGAAGFAELSGSPIDCTIAAATASTNVPLSSVKITPAGVAGATHYQIVVTAKAQ